jgi:hypothetical protein
MSAETAIQLVVNNYEPVYRELRRIIDRITWWDDDDDTWNDIDKAAQEYRGLVESLDPDAPGFSDLQGINYEAVDFIGLVHEELEQENLDAGRRAEAGL